VSKLADELLGHLSTEDALARIQTVNQPGRSSAEVQATFGDFVRELGFESEKVGLFGSDELALMKFATSAAELPTSVTLARLSTTRSRSASVCKRPTAQNPALDNAR
jgi:hypothetical protein